VSIKKTNFAQSNLEPEQSLFIFTVKNNQYIIVFGVDMRTITRAMGIWVSNVQNIVPICGVGFKLH
jgi:ribosomal protein S2